MTDPESSSPRPPVAPPPPARAPRRRALTYVIIGSALCTAVLALAARGRPTAPPLSPMTRAPLPAPTLPPALAPTPNQRPRVELVFALDTTGSMSSLIAGAKRKIWSLASFVAQGQPTPDLRVGLVAYRDLGDAYVTRLHDLDDDLDRVYQRLQRFQAGGGGDGPEHVARALHEAVNRMSWSEDANVVKVIYLVGDAPPHTNYHDGYDCKKAAQTAAGRGIQIHTVRCGDDPATERTWRQIAALGKGEFLTIGQDGGMRDDRTPYDEELAHLHDRLSGTAVAYGAYKAGVAEAQAAAAQAPPSVKASRAAYMAAKAKVVGGKGDLIEGLESGEVKLEEMSQEELPPELRGKDRAQQKAALMAKEAERDDLTRRIGELSKAREKHLAEQAARAAEDGAVDGFDEAAKKSLRRSAARKPAAGLKL
jgi:hypothetical protein